VRIYPSAPLRRGVAVAALVVWFEGDGLEGLELARRLVESAEWERVGAVEPWAYPEAYAEAKLPFLPAWLPRPLLRLAARLHAAAAGCTGAAALELGGVAAVVLAFRPWRLEVLAGRGRVALSVDAEGRRVVIAPR